MATFKGFVHAIEVRDDGWVAVTLLAPHAGNALQTFLIPDLDGAIDQAHRRLGWLSLLRDALARVLPVEVDYGSDKEQGDLISDVTIHPRPSIAGRPANRRVVGTVIGISIADLGPLSAASPYLDPPDPAGITLLTDAGSIEQATLDLQRPDPLTAQAMLALLGEAHRTRRPVALSIGGFGGGDHAAGGAVLWNASTGGGSFIQACEWLTVPTATLDYVHAFVERIGQRYESYEGDAAAALSLAKVEYMTAPAQTPEGDVSDNGSFAPAAGAAWVHDDSPLLARLEAALRDRLQVVLGLDGDRIHEVVLIGHLGSAARPLWIEVRRSARPCQPADPLCENVPTIRSPGDADLDAVPVALTWCGEAYFNEGIWRFVVRAASPAGFSIDGETPCRTTACGEDQGGATCYHAYLEGLHRIELCLTARHCGEPFQLQAYRIR